MPSATAALAPRYSILGREVQLPALVRDASSATAVFLVAQEAVQALLPGNAFQVVEAAPGLAQVVLGFVDYRDNDLGDYNEAMIVFFVRPRGDAAADEGTFIYKLPVNQEFTCVAGRDIWGFPKTVEGVDIVRHDDAVEGSLTMGGALVFRLRVPTGGDAIDTGDLPMTTYTYLPSGPAATPFVQGGATSFGDPGSVRLELGDHPLAEELRRLGLPTTPILSTWTAHMHGSFGAPRPVQP